MGEKVPRRGSFSCQYTVAEKEVFCIEERKERLILNPVSYPLFVYSHFFKKGGEGEEIAYVFKSM